MLQSMGLGRIGRAALKQLFVNKMMIPVAVNDLVPVDNLAYLLKYDTVYGHYENEVHVDQGNLVINGSEIKVLSEKDPARLPWKDLDVDLVFECSGVFSEPEDLRKHLIAGAQHVILSAPVKGEGVPMVVHAANRTEDDNVQMFSCASCTTNCIAPVVEVINRRMGIKKALMTTIHAYTSTQGIIDRPAGKMRRGRAGAANFVPTSTGAAVATTRVIPELKGKFDGVAVRGPVPAGSIADIVILTNRSTSKQEINDIFIEESKTDRYSGVLGVTDELLVSSDIIRDTRASIVDLSMIQVVDGDLVKIMSWYDNEWGYVSQMIREAERMDNAWSVPRAK